MLDAPHNATGMLRVIRPQPLPVAALLVGKRAEEAAALLPRIFNLCRVAQARAARRAFGLPDTEGGDDALREEILREHLMRLCLTLPGRLGQGQRPLPSGWQKGTASARAALFGPAGRLPESIADFGAFLASGTGIAPVLAAVRACFAPFEAAAGSLPMVSPATILQPLALENSVAARQAHHPVMRALEASLGRGPLWRLTARAYDAQALMYGDLPEGTSPATGIAITPAARGVYAISATLEQGIVTAFRRVTPTDHLTVRGGMLDRMLASLPPQKAGLAPLLLDILDPCCPLRLKEANHA